MAPPINSQHRDATDKSRHIFERGQERLDIIGICWAEMTSIEIANANVASINVSSRVISVPRNLNPRNRGNASKFAGNADAISSSSPVIALS
jgi:hypothetical protein